MLKIIKRYFYLIHKNHLNSFWIISLFLVLPIIFSIILIICFKDNIINTLNSWSSDIINFLVLLSWFLFTSISLLISNIKINEDVIDNFSNKLKINKNESKNIISELKELLVLDIVFQFFMITIDTLLIIIYNWFSLWNITLFFILFFFFLSLLWLTRLIRNFLLFQKNIQN